MMDGIKRYKPATINFESEPEPQEKNSIWKLPLKHKYATLIALVSLFNFLFPHPSLAAEAPKQPLTGPMVFVVGQKFIYLDNLNLQLSKLYEKKQMQEQLDKQIELNKKVKAYLESQGSPLAAYTSTLLQLSNWKKIISLSNAESGLCEHYPVQTSNCWGVGGSNLWYMGSNLSEGIVSMNQFLNSYPNNSKVKYAQMTFKQMNGLYKQPAAQHWVDNNQEVYSALTAIENSL